MLDSRQDKYVDTTRPECGCGRPSDAIGDRGELLCARCWLDRYASQSRIKLDNTRSLLYEKLHSDVGVSEHEKSRHRQT